MAADVLEHLRDPEAVLLALKPFLTPNATIVTSIPNVRNLGVLQSAVEGNWTYQAAGILDRTHLRFFTLREIRSMFQRLGYDVEYTAGVNDPAMVEWERLAVRVPSELARSKFTMFQTTRWSSSSSSSGWSCAAPRVPAAGPQTPDTHPLTSIVILTYNELEYTRQCVASVLEHTAALFELIFVDNASTDGTLDYLQTIPDATLVRNAHNLGFAGGNNQALARSWRVRRAAQQRHDRHSLLGGEFARANAARLRHRVRRSALQLRWPGRRSCRVCPTRPRKSSSASLPSVLVSFRARERRRASPWASVWPCATRSSSASVGSILSSGRAILRTTTFVSEPCSRVGPAGSPMIRSSTTSGTARSSGRGLIGTPVCVATPSASPPNGTSR